MSRKLLLLFSLYFCQGLPGGFLAVALPVILREQGLDLTTIGLTGVLSLPWVLKIFWAPLVDRYGSRRIGRRRTWLLPAQTGMMGVTIAFATFRPDGNLWLVAVLFLVLNLFAATQDIAVDGWAVDLLDEDELGPGNSAQIAGFKLGNLFGGGVLLALSGYLGWQGDFLLMGACIFVAMLLVLATPEPASSVEAAPQSVRAIVRTLFASIAAQGPWLWIFFVYAKFGETFGGVLVKPMLVDNGFSREMIGVIDGIYGSIATIAGAAVAGLLMRRRSWAVTLGMFSAVQGMALIAIGLYQTTVVEVTPFAVINAIENFGGGGVGVCIFALAMRGADKSVGASHFTAAQVTYILGAFVAGPSAGAVGDQVGYLPVMVAGGTMALVLAALAGRAARGFGVSTTLGS